MREQLKALYALQQIDTRLEAVKKEQAGLDQGANLKQQLAAAETHRKKLEDELRQAESELQDSELSLKSIEQKKSTFEKKLYGGGVSNPKELSGIEKEIEMLGRSRAQLDERILALYELVDQRKTALREFEARITAAEQRLHQVEQKYAAESGRLSEEKTRLEAQRAASTDGIDASLLKRYDSIRARAGGVGIAPITNGKCGGCHTGLTTFLLRKIHEETGPVSCENCGRLLVQVNE